MRACVSLRDVQLRDEAKKLLSLQQAKSAQEKRYFTQFGEPQREKVSGSVDEC